MSPCRSRWSALRFSIAAASNRIVASRSNMYDDISRQYTPSDPKMLRESAGGPRFAPASVGMPARRRMWAVSAVVVLLPFVPVTPTKRARDPLARTARNRSSTSATIGTDSAIAFAATGCGAGRRCGIPGERTSASIPASGTAARSTSRTPASRAASRRASLSSQAATSAPQAASRVAAASPARPSPITAKRRPKKRRGSAPAVIAASGSRGRSAPAPWR
jgi:hypothetical protein